MKRAAPPRSRSRLVVSRSTRPGLRRVEPTSTPRRLATVRRAGLRSRPATASATSATHEPLPHSAAGAALGLAAGGPADAAPVDERRQPAQRGRRQVSTTAKPSTAMSRCVRSTSATARASPRRSAPDPTPMRRRQAARPARPATDSRSALSGDGAARGPEGNAGQTSRCRPTPRDSNKLATLRSGWQMQQTAPNNRTAGLLIADERFAERLDSHRIDRRTGRVPRRHAACDRGELGRAVAMVAFGFNRATTGTTTTARRASGPGIGPPPSRRATARCGRRGETRTRGITPTP